VSVAGGTLVAALAEVVGADRVRAAAEPVDGVRPRWVVAPTTVEQVARVLALAADAGLAVIPRGSGSALGLGRPPARAGLVLDLRGLDRVLEDRPDDLTISVEAGLTAGALAARLGARRQWLPVDPPGWRRRTLGGLVATAAAGPLRARYGTLRDLLLGVRFVQADGVVTWGGARVVKSVSGYDVPKLMVGALGTLGVLCELTLRLHPAPDVERTWLVTVPDAEAAAALVAAVADSTLEPSRVELLDAAALRATAAPAGALAVAVAFGSVEEAVAEQGARLEALARAVGGAATVVPDFWERYDAALVAGEGEVVLHVASLPSHLAPTLAAIHGAVGALGPGAGGLVTGCARLGLFRVVLTGAEVEAAARLVTTLREAVAPVEGSVIVHAGPRALRERVDPWGPVAPEVLALLRAVKATFDPAGVLNPGRFVGGL